MEEKFKYYCKTPEDSSEEELNEFYKLVIEGGKVQKKGLLNRIRNCALLGYCVYENQIIGVSAIKRPQKIYKDKIIKNANLQRKSIDLEYEIGYSFTSPKFRRKGISSSIKSNNIKWMKKIGGTIFSTTAIPSSQNFLLSNGFVHLGEKYDGKNDKYLKYFELTIEK